MKVIVTDAGERKALAAIRALGKAGVEVTAADTSQWAQGLWSRYARSRCTYPNPVKDPDAFAEALIGHLRRAPHDVLLPQSDYTVLATAQHKAAFEEVTQVPVPDYQTIRRVRDKYEVTKLAEALGIPVPRTWAPQSREDLEAVAGETAYPCVVKYRTGTGAIGVYYANSPEELITIYEGPPRRPDIVFEDMPPIVQEYIPGKVHDVGVLFNRGEPRAVFTQMRDKTWPASGGRGVENVSTDEADIKEYGVRLMRELGWHGPADVEFKRDERDGVPRLMEVNIRFWGGTDLAIQAGVNFPLLAAQMAMDGDVDPVLEYQVGLRYRWPFPYQFKQAMERPDRAAALREFARLDAGVRMDVWPSDPGPHMAKIAHTGYIAARRSAARLLKRSGNSSDIIQIDN